MKWFTGMLRGWSVRACWRLGYGAASVVAAVGFCGAGFMLWFLIALLREGAPRSATGLYRPPERERALHMLRVRYDGAIAAGRHAPAASIAWTYWRTKIMRRARMVQVLLLWTCVPFWRAGLARNQSQRATSSGNAASSDEQNNRKCAMS